MSVVDDDEIGGMPEEAIPVARGFDEVDADDEMGVMLEEADAGAGKVALEPGKARRDDDGGIDAELVTELIFPLVAEVGGREDDEAAGAGAVEQLAGDKGRLDGLADADVVGDEQPYRIEPKRHEQRDVLIGAGGEGEVTERAKRRGAGAELEAGSVVEEESAGDIAGVFRAWRVEAALGKRSF